MWPAVSRPGWHRAVSAVFAAVVFCIFIEADVVQSQENQDVLGWEPIINVPQRDTEAYFKLLRSDYQFRFQEDYITYSIDIKIDPCRDLVIAGGRGDSCCKESNVAGCQHYTEVVAGPDLQVAYLQNAHIANCRGTPFEQDPNCGTYLEVHRPGNKAVLADVRIDQMNFPNGYQTVFLATHRVCLGQHEVWWVVRTRAGPYVQRITPFMVTAPTCSAPPGMVEPPVPKAAQNAIP